MIPNMLSIIIKHANLVLSPNHKLYLSKLEGHFAVGLLPFPTPKILIPHASQLLQLYFKWD